MAKKRKDQTEKSPQTMRFALRIGVKFIIILLLVLLVQFVLSIGYDFGYNLFAAPAMSSAPGREITFTVESGQSTSEITANLKEAGLIRDKFAFRCQILFYDKVLQPGEYKLSTSMTSKEILMYLDDGPGSQAN